MQAKKYRHRILLDILLMRCTTVPVVVVVIGVDDTGDDVVVELTVEVEVALVVLV